MTKILHSNISKVSMKYVLFSNVVFRIWFLLFLYSIWSIFFRIFGQQKAMSLQAFYGARNGRKQLSHKRKSIIYLLYNLDLSTGFRLGCCIQNQIYFIDSKYLHCSNNFCSCANILKLQSQISNRHLIGLYWIVFIFHQIMKGSARKKNHVFILPHRNS